MRLLILACAALVLVVGCGGGSGSNDSATEWTDTSVDLRTALDVYDVVPDVPDVAADMPRSVPDVVTVDIVDSGDFVEAVAEVPDVPMDESGSSDAVELPDLVEEIAPDIVEVGEAEVLEPTGLFSTPESLIADFADNKTGGSLPVIRVDGDGGLHAAWRQSPKPDPSLEAILYRYKPAGGEWGPMEVVEEHATGSVLSPSGMAVGPKGEVAITWAEDKGVFDDSGNEYCNDVYYKVRSPLGGWGPIFVVVQLAAPAWPDCSQSRPDIAIDDKGGFHFVWDDQRHDPPEGESYIIAADIYYRHTPSGLPEDFGPEVRLTEVTQGSVHPRIHAGPYGAIHVVWSTNHDEPGPDKYWIKYRRKPAWAEEFDWEETVDWLEDHGQRVPEVAEDSSGRAHVAWLEYKEFLVMNIHYRQRGFEPGSFNEEETVVDNPFPKGGVSRGLASGDQKNPSLAIGPGGTVHAVWQDASAGLTYESSGNQYPRLDIYYANTGL